MIILDRDGVINRLVIDPEQGTVNSPLHPSQVELIPGSLEAIRNLTKAGFKIAIATNQPAAAKGTTTKANLDDVHASILEAIESAGGKISSSHICFHRAEDHCRCRKPATGLLEDALKDVSLEQRRKSWMVGDGVTDIEAGTRLELNTAYLGPKRCDHCKCLEERNLHPKIFANLKAFSDWLCERREEYL